MERQDCWVYHLQVEFFDGYGVCLGIPRVHTLIWKTLSCFKWDFLTEVYIHACMDTDCLHIRLTLCMYIQYVQ